MGEVVYQHRQDLEGAILVTNVSESKSCGNSNTDHIIYDFYCAAEAGSLESCSGEVGGELCYGNGSGDVVVKIDAADLC